MQAAELQQRFPTEVMGLPRNPSQLQGAARAVLLPATLKAWAFAFPCLQVGDLTHRWKFSSRKKSCQSGAEV